MKNIVKIDYNFLFEPSITNGLNDEKLAISKEKVKSGLSKLLDMIENKEVGLADLISQDLTDIHKYVKSVKGLYNDLIVVGIGGSSLGLEALVNALLPYGYNSLSFSERGCFPRIWIADNIDPHKIHWILKHCNPSDTLVCVITKSGTTVETMSNFSLIYNWLDENISNVSKQIVSITDAKTGLLIKFVEEKGITNFIIPKNVGGRFSVLSPVGLLPAALLGIDIDNLLKGASSILNIDYEQIIVLSSVYLYYLNNNYNMNILMPYSSRLEKFSEWFCQLWGESLGKKIEGNIRLGSTPVRATGAIDQHSQMQLYKDGPNDKILTFIEIDAHEFEKKIPAQSITDLSYLDGLNMGDLLNIELRCTEAVLLAEGKPNLKLIIDSIDELSMGALLMLFQYVVATIGLSLSCDPFDQPGVEEGKQYAYGVLGRESFNIKKKDFENIYIKTNDYTI